MTIDSNLSMILCECISIFVCRRMSFKTYEERKQAAEKMCEEGKGFQQLFQRAPFNKRVRSFISQTLCNNFIISLFLAYDSAEK